MSAKIIRRALFGILVSGMAWVSSGLAAEKLEIATFAGGCFWCVESDFDGVPGVAKTISGYTGGMLQNPTYKQVSAGGTGHIEAVEIHFDPAKVSYEKLLDVFWHSVDPTDAGGQFCDRLKQPIVTPIREATPFYPAETYHQDYYKKNPLHYRVYRYGCGRDARLTELWGKDAHRGIEKH
jgi:peptide-methionine (S)-S-oxide reductase